MNILHVKGANNRISQYKHVFLNLFYKVDGYLHPILLDNFVFLVPSFFLFINILLSEIFYPSIFFTSMYICFFRKKKLMWNEILLLKYIHLFLQEPLFTFSSVFYMVMFWFLYNTEYYDNYFFYDECIICFEKKFMGTIFDCCPYVRLCKQCEEKVERCPICKN